MMKNGKGVRTIFSWLRAAKPVRHEISSDPFFGGYSLLEVVLALAILAGSFAVLGEVMRLGDRNAEQARDTTQAVLLADSVMSELLAGARVLGNVTAQFNLATEPPWTYSIVVEPTDYLEVVSVRVTVAQDTAPELDPARCGLVRWLPNPDYVPTQTADEVSASSGSSTSGQGAR
jgi:type II secretory pathway pseudopilin PulG